MIARRTIEDDQVALRRIAYSDAARILHIFPGCEMLRFKLDTSLAENTLELYVGDCGDSEIWVSSKGSVRKVVVRESGLRKAGQMFEVRKPPGQYFKAIEPFKWIPILRDGISSPVPPKTHAIVLMYMHIWARKKMKGGVVLPPLVYEDLYSALVTSRKALEMDRILPEKQRLVPRDMYEKLVDIERGDESSDVPDSPQAPNTPKTPELQHHPFTKQPYWQKHVTPISDMIDSDASLHIAGPYLHEHAPPITVVHEEETGIRMAEPPEPPLQRPPPVPPEAVQTSNAHFLSNILPTHRESAQALMLRLYGQIL